MDSKASWKDHGSSCTSDSLPGDLLDRCDSRQPVAAAPAAGISLTRLELAKTVTKGWGEERWLVPEGGRLGFKLIRLEAGHRTSLQYHERKEEANLVLSGEAILHAASGPDAPITTSPLHQGDIVHVRPGQVHRIEAVTRVILVEASTPELDDVIRLADDWSRGNGRIAAEHAAPPSPPSPVSPQP